MLALMRMSDSVMLPVQSGVLHWNLVFGQQGASSAAKIAGFLPASASARIAAKITPLNIAGKPPIIALCQRAVLLQSQGPVRAPVATIIGRKTAWTQTQLIPLLSRERGLWYKPGRWFTNSALVCSAVRGCLTPHFVVDNRKPAR